MVDPIFELAWETASLITRYNSQYAREYSVTQALENILLLSLEIVELVIITGFLGNLNCCKMSCMTKRDAAMPRGADTTAISRASLAEIELTKMCSRVLK